MDFRDTPSAHHLRSVIRATLVRRYEEGAPNSEGILASFDAMPCDSPLHLEYSIKAHPIFTREKWKKSVSTDNTVMGYWTWVENEVSKRAKEFAEQYRRDPDSIFW